MSAKAVCRLGVFAYHDVVTANGNGLRRLINAIQLRVNTGEADGGEVEAAAVEMPEDSLPKLLIGGKQKQRSRVALGHTVASVFPMRPSFSVGITEEEAEHCPAALDNISYTSYMLRIAYEGGPADVMAAILSCALSYEEIACRLKAQYPGCWEHPFFGEWVSGYISEEYHEANQKLIALMERLADGFDERQIARLSEVFKNCSRYEAAFWDMGWEMKK